MFNVRNKIYVTTGLEVDLVYNRVIVVDPGFDEVVFDIQADPLDSTSVGLLFKATSLDILITEQFNDSWSDFYDFLVGEEKLYIVTNEDDYTKLYARILLEMQDTYGIAGGHLDELLEYQRLKEFLMGDRLPAFKAMYDTVLATETPEGNLFSSTDAISLPAEMAYAFYKWGYITKDLADAKIATLAPLLLQGQVQNIMGGFKSALGKSTAVLQAYLNDNTIDTVDDIIAAVDSNPILRKGVLEGSNFDLTDAAELAEVVTLCELIIDNDFDYDANPAVDKAEFQLFVDLFNTGDVDIIDAAKYNFMATGFAESRSNKFNSVLMMNVD